MFNLNKPQKTYIHSRVHAHTCIFLFLSFVLSIITPAPITPAPVMPAPQNLTPVIQTHKISPIITNSKQIAPLEGQYLSPILTILYIELFILLAQQNTKDQVLIQLQPQELIKNFLKEYFSHFLATFFHETGHALVAKLLTKKPVHIYLGNNTHTDKPYITLGPYSLSGLKPATGHTEYSTSYKNFKTIEQEFIQYFTQYCAKNHIDKNSISQEDIAKHVALFHKDPEFQKIIHKLHKNKPQTIAILLAGGICGIAGYLGTKLLINFIINLMQHQGWTPGQTAFKKACSDTFNTATLFDSVIISQLINMLVPFKTNTTTSDGAQLWEQLGISDSIIDGVSECAPYLEMLVYIYCAHQKAHLNHSSAPLTDQIIIGLLNFQLRHMLSLHT